MSPAQDCAETHMAQGCAEAHMAQGGVLLPRPDIVLLLELEEALGALAAFAGKLKCGTWQVGELVTFRQIALEAAGDEADYMRLGAQMLSDGFERHRDAALALLQRAGIGL